MKPVKNVATATKLAVARAAPRAGQIIGDRYRLEEPLERGAMGSVWKAEQIRLRAPCALKFLDPSLIGDPEMHDRFMQEARSAAAVRSVHVVQIFDYGSEGPVPYIAMELLEGENLDARLSSRGTLTPSELNKIFAEVARGIGKAHSMGVVHRDVKPGNIFIAREGEHEVTKLIDFGIAKVKADALKFTQIVGTQLGTLLGTPQYMSPEQVRGSSTVDFRTDIWALAIIACECLTGRYPFSGTTIGDLTVQICTEKPRAPSSLGQVPAGFDQWFFKGTSKKPIKRFASVEEMADALSKLLLAQGDSAPAAAWSGRLLALSSGVEVRRAWATTSGRVSNLLLQLRRALARLGTQLSTQSSSLAAIVVVKLRAFARSERWSLLQSLGSRPALVASLLLLVVCALALSWLPRRGSSAASARNAQAAPAQALQAALPAPAAPSVHPTAVARSEDEVAVSAVPTSNEGRASDKAPAPTDAVPSSDAAQLVPAASEAPQPAAGAAHRIKRERTSAGDRAPSSSPLGPMSVAMQKAAARIMRAEDERDATAAQRNAKLSARGSPTPGRTPPPPAPANVKPTPKAAPKAAASQAHPFDDRL
jgi:eukaryotic-like serine/threonine-protein kinase